jgi:hypothetical protein
MSAWVLILMFANTQSMVSVTIDMPTEVACRREVQRMSEQRTGAGAFVRGFCINRSP